MIFVDPTRDYGIRGRRNLFCHMWSDSDNDLELHRFAEILGVKRCWFHVSFGRTGRFAHYDLRPEKRALAIEAGAIEKSLRDYVKERL